MPVTIDAYPPAYAQGFDPIVSIVHNSARLGWPYKLRSSDQRDIMIRIADIETGGRVPAGVVCEWPRSLAQIHPALVKTTVTFKNHKRIVTRKRIPANPLTCVVTVTIPGGQYGPSVMSFTTNIWEIWEDGMFIYTGPSTDPATD